MSDSLLSILENERRYTARELHDGVAQTTLQLGLQAGICGKLLADGHLEMLAKTLTEMEERIQLASTQVREMIADMRPPRLEPDADLDTYIQQAIDTHLERGGPPVEYRFEWSGRLPDLSAQQRLALFRIVQEALLNVRKHAEAERIRLILLEDNHNFFVIISDNGQGFDPVEVAARPVDKGGAGLANLQARAQAVGGSLNITRDTTGDWTEVMLRLPKSDSGTEPEQFPDVSLSDRLSL